jgi:dihydrolipoamide dehydrogenase
MRFVILGGGPAGYAAAQAASALGADVTLVEDQGLGGNCNLTDAIPSKTLIATANVMAEIERAETLGVDFEHARPKVDLLRTIAHARWVAAHQSRSIRDRLEGTTTRLVAGQGHVSAAGNVHVHSGGRELDVPYDALLVATGASPWEPPFCNVDHDRVFTTREVLDRRELPRHLLVVGAGATGCEYAEFFGSCGSRVTLLSARPQILPAEDPDVAEIVQEAFLARGIDLQFDARVSLVERTSEGVMATTADGRAFTGSHAIICMGQRANTGGLGLDTIGVELDDRGAIVVDDHLCSTAEKVYAAGDVAGGMMLASTAAMQGRHAALHALGRASAPLRLQNVPWTIFTRPECASVGVTERAALEQDRPAAVTKHYLGNNPRGVISGQREGMIKLVADPSAGTILGGSIVGYRASENIGTLALAIEAGMTVDQLAASGTVTPSMSESLQRAAEKAETARLAAQGRDTAAAVASASQTTTAAA